MRILIAPDAFKDCLPSREVADAIAGGIREILPDADLITLPLADGGEGTVDVLTGALNGRIHFATVSDPLGRPVKARYGVAGRTAILEAAEACGLQRLCPEERNPLLTTTYGVGELLLRATENDCNHFLIGLGGTSTCDGGLGMLSVPGILEAMKGTRVEVLCDVGNSFVGPDGAARVFGPQKGASDAEVEILENRMLERAQRIERETGIRVADIPSAGAAGGLGGAFLAYFGANLIRGIDRILDLTGFDKALEGADLVITGEGKSDRQTLSGKVALGVLQRTGAVPTILLSGKVEDRELLLKAGFRKVEEVSPRALLLQEALKPEVARENLKDAVKRCLSDI